MQTKPRQGQRQARRGKVRSYTMVIRNNHGSELIRMQVNCKSSHRLCLCESQGKKKMKITIKKLIQNSEEGALWWFGGEIHGRLHYYMETGMG